jgi:hypothetical protein
VISVPEHWLLAPEKDERDRKIAALEAQVAALKSAEAALSVELTSNEGESLESIDGSFPQYPNLTEAEIARLVEAARGRHPEVTSFDSAPAHPSAAGQDGLNLLIARMSGWQAPTDDQISRYQAEYKGWLDTVRKRFEQFGHFLTMRHRLRRIRISLANTSSRPADEVLLELTVHGGTTLLASVGDEVPDLIAQIEKLPLGVELPAPPLPPRGEYLYEAFARNAHFGLGHSDIASQLRSYMPDLSAVRSSLAKRDRHEFYRREEEDKPTAQASFSCEEFRHQRAPKRFSLWIIVPIQAESAKGKLHFRASARNMSAPVDLYIPIDIGCETRSTYEVAAKWRIKE